MAHPRIGRTPPPWELSITGTQNSHIWNLDIGHYPLKIRCLWLDLWRDSGVSEAGIPPHTTVHHLQLWGLSHLKGDPHNMLSLAYLGISGHGLVSMGSLSRLLRPWPWSSVPQTVVSLILACWTDGVDRYKGLRLWCDPSSLYLGRSEGVWCSYRCL